MEKNEKRSYTVGISNEDTPTIKIRGKWLKEKGFDIDTRYEVIEGKNMLILIKKTELMVKEETVKYQISKLEKQLNQLKNNQ